jgi:polysaccharide biosynthesis protein PslH
MKILMLFPYAPLPPPMDLGGMKRNIPFLIELCKYHDVSVLAYGTARQEQEFRRTYGDHCDQIRFIPFKRSRWLTLLELIWLTLTGRSRFRRLYRKSMQRAIDEMCAIHCYELIHCCVQMFGIFRFPENVSVTSDTHEVTYDLIGRAARNTPHLLRKLAGYWTSKVGKHDEMEFCRKFDLLITTTRRDQELFRRDLPDQNIQVIQNGAGEAFFNWEDTEPEPCSMVFTGLFSHLPNSDGILYFLDRIFPLIAKQEPTAKIWVVGKSPTKAIQARASGRVIVTGFVDDVRPYMARAQVFVVPLLAGGGIRGKALEAMAMRKPIVSTSIGVEGILLRHMESALIADSPDDFADCVVRLFCDQTLRARISGEAHAIAREHYDWRSKGRELEHALSQVRATRAQASSALVHA